jgi:hypothetical protein
MLEDKKTNSPKRSEPEKEKPNRNEKAVKTV